MNWSRNIDFNKRMKLIKQDQDDGFQNDFSETVIDVSLRDIKDMEEVC